MGMNVCVGGNDDDDVGGVDVERNADVALPLPSVPTHQLHQTSSVLIIDVN